MDFIWASLVIFCIFRFSIPLLNLCLELLAEPSRKKRELKQREELRLAASRYKKELGKKRSQLITRDDYGDTDDSKWKAEISKFYNLKLENKVPSWLLSRTFLQVSLLGGGSFVIGFSLHIWTGSLFQQILTPLH